jgi:hypothetical protein
MRKRTMVIITAAAAAAGLFILTCSKDSGPAGPGQPSTTWTYTVSGNTIIIDHPQTISTQCYGTQWSADTADAYTDSAVFTLSAGGDTLFSQTDQGIMVLTRIGTGTGIQGQWLTDQYGFDVTIEIGPSTITASTCYADIFMGEEAPLIEANYNITVVRQSCSSVLLIGHTTNEQVTITYTQVGDSPDNLDADRTYSSNNAQHAPGTVYANPASCPNQAPGWVAQFLANN